MFRSRNYFFFLLITLIVCIFLFACNQGKENMRENEIFHVSLSDKRGYSIDELFQDYHFVPLETGGPMLINDLDKISRIMIHGQDLYIGSYKDIKVFDKDGRFKRVIDHLGESPGSYLSAVAFVVGRNGDVLILDRMTSTIYTYDREDQFTRKYPLGDLDIKDIALLDDSLLILRGSEHRAGDKFHVVNRNSGEAVCSFYPMNDRVFTIWRHNHFYHYKGKMLFSEYQNNHIYEITPDRALLRYTIDVDGRMPPDGFWDRDDLTDVQLYYESKNQGYISHIPVFVETDNFLFLRFEAEDDDLEDYALISKQNGKATVIESLSFGPDFHWEPDIVFPQEDGWVVIPIPAYLLFEKGADEIKARFLEVTEESNPILFIGKLK